MIDETSDQLITENQLIFQKKNGEYYCFFILF